MRPDNHLYVSYFEGTDRFKVHIHDPYSTRELLEFVGQHVATILFRECNWDIRVRQSYDKTYEFITFGKLEKGTR